MFNWRIQRKILQKQIYNSTNSFNLQLRKTPSRRRCSSTLMNTLKLPINNPKVENTGHYVYSKQNTQKIWNNVSHYGKLIEKTYQLSISLSLDVQQPYINYIEKKNNQLTISLSLDIQQPSPYHWLSKSHGDIEKAYQLSISLSLDIQQSYIYR